MKSLTKRLILFVGAILSAMVVTLAFTPHYGCACGQDLPAKANGSKLSFIVRRVLG